MQNEIIKIISDQAGLPIEDLTPSTKLDDTNGMDSLDKVEIVMSIEQKFNIEISDEQSDKLKTIKDVVDFVREKKK